MRAIEARTIAIQAKDGNTLSSDLLEVEEFIRADARRGSFFTKIYHLDGLPLAYTPRVSALIGELQRSGFAAYFVDGNAIFVQWA